MLRSLILLGLVVPIVLGCIGSSSSSGGSSGGSRSCSKVTIKTRREWGARAPKKHVSISVPVPYFFIHHTVTSTCTTFSSCSQRVRNIQNHHMDTNGWDDIGYSFLVGEDGNVYEGRGWSSVGAHTSGYNTRSFAAAMIGDYTNSIPNQIARTAAKNLIACGVELGKISNSYTLRGHRDVGTTDCPGDELYNEIKKWPNYG